MFIFGSEYKSLAEQLAKFSKLGHNDVDGIEERQLDGEYWNFISICWSERSLKVVFIYYHLSSYVP